MLIDYFPNRPPDEYAIVVMINDLYMRHPEKFGDTKTQEKLKKELSNYISEQNSSGYGTVHGFWTFFAERLDHYKLEPFKDATAVFVAPNFWQDVSPILDRFKRYYSIYSVYEGYSGIGKWLTIDNSHEHVPEKVDYVITGNILNDPNCRDTAGDTFLACANLLKEGGRAIHMLNTGGALREPGSIPLKSKSWHERAGQEICYMDPNYKPEYLYWGEEMPGVMVLEQKREINLAPKPHTRLQVDDLAYCGGLQAVNRPKIEDFGLSS